MGQRGFCSAKTNETTDNQMPRSLQQDQLQKFHEGLQAHPIFEGRFDSVPLDRIAAMASKIYEILYYRATKNKIMKFEKVLILHTIMNITEGEIDAMFALFFKECRVNEDEFWDNYEDYLTELKDVMMDARTTRKKYENFYTEVKRNPVLNRRFLYTSPYVFSKMVDEIIYVADALFPEREFSIVGEAHKKMNITAQEFDEYIRLFFEMCSPDINYHKAVGPKFEKIREIIVSEKFDPVDSFKRALLYPAEGPHYDIPLANLRIMASTMVKFIRDADTISIEEIKDIHKSIKITEAGFREVSRVFLATCSRNEAFRKKASIVLLNLEKLMVKQQKEEMTFADQLTEQFYGDSNNRLVLGKSREIL